MPVYLDQEPLFLLLRVYRYWDFPKGLVESGETPLAAAVRELREEAALKVQFKWGKKFVETEPYGQNKIARYYLGLVHERSVTIGPEHMEFRWVGLKAARKLLVPRVRRVLEWAAAQVT